MRTSLKRLSTPGLVTLVAILASLLAHPASACFCSGRCYIGPTGPQCGFSAFLCRDCIESIDFCEDYVCFSSPSAGVPDNGQIKDRLSLLPALKCASQAPPKSSVAQVQIQVVRLKART